MSTARVKLASTSPEKLNEIMEEVNDIIEKTGISISGPIPLPTRRLNVPTRKSPDGEGRESFETWQMRIHKRLVDLDVNERALRLIMRIQIPREVNVQIEIIEEE